MESDEVWERRNFEAELVGARPIRGGGWMPGDLYMFLMASSKIIGRSRGSASDERPKYINYEYLWNWYFRWIPAPRFRWLEQRLGWHYLIVAKAASSGR